MTTKHRIAAVLLAALPAGALAAGPTLAGCPIFPKNNYWNTRVDNLPLHASSNAWVATVGPTARLHADWGNVVADYYGIPYVVVPGTQPAATITFDPVNGSPDESDPGPYPIPNDAPVEGGPAAPLDADRHVIALENTNCRLYELYNAIPQGGGGFKVLSAAKFDLNSHALRPLLWTSADATGGAILPGLVRYDEAATGEINHAIRFTANLIWGLDAGGPGGKSFIWPARHWSGSSTDPNRPPMGARFRLKQSFVINPSLNPLTQTILRAMKKYGLYLADGGSNWFFQGVTDTRWDDLVFSQLGQIAGSNFEVVDTLKLRINNDSGQAIQFQPDLNLDLNADVFFRNAGTGQLWRMFGNGLGFTGGAMAYTEVNTAWQIAAEGDFNGDGIRDLLWRNTATGQVYVMPFTTAGLPAPGAVAYIEPNAAWKIVATPDLDGDGRSDILFWNSTTGQVWALLMNGTAVKAQGMAYNEPNTQWRIVASGDFAATGIRNQLLWRNQSTGQVFLHTIVHQGGSLFGSSGTVIYTEPNTAWTIAGTGDLNGDGRDDIVYRNAADGRVHGLLMGPSGISGGGGIHTEPNLAWKIVAMGDYNGDGKADLLWRNDTTGQVFMMLMNGTAIAQQAMVYTEPNTAWTVLGSGSYAQ